MMQSCKECDHEKMDYMVKEMDKATILSLVGFSTRPA